MINNFKKVEVAKSHRLIIAISGLDKQGKTTFALSAPGPILYFKLDTGDEGVVDKFVNEKEIYTSEYKISVYGGSDHNRDEWTRFKMDWDSALKSKAQTIIVDTATESWALNRLARLGKLAKVMPHQYVEVNAEHTKLLKDAYASDKNVILIHKVKPVYVNDKRTDEYEPAGYSDTPYIVQINLVAYYSEELEQYAVRIKNCRQNGDLKDMDIPIFDIHTGFQTLYDLVYGG